MREAFAKWCVLVTLAQVAACGGASLKSQLGVLRDKPASDGAARIGKVSRADLAGGDFAAPAYGASDGGPVVLKGDGNDLCFHVDVKDLAGFLTQKKIDERIERYKEHANLAVRTHTSLSEIEADEWPAPTIHHADVRRLSVKDSPGDPYIDARGHAARHSPHRHVQYDVCVPKPEIAPGSKYLSLITVPERGDKGIAVWEITD